MNLLSREPNHFFNRFQEDFNQLVRSMNERWPLFNDEESNVVTSEWMPAVDIVEEDNQFVIKADIPGVDPKDIQVSMDNGMLSIKGERKTEKKEKGNGFRRVECSHGMFYRRFSLPESADPEKISAKGKNGVLTITLGKREAAKPKLISIQS